MKGFVKLHRELLDWQWYTHSYISRVYVHFLLKANHQNKVWQGHQVKRGQLITSIRHLSDELSLTDQKIRTALKKLIASGDITCETTNQFTLITITEYDSNQKHLTNNNKQATNRTTNKQQSNNKLATTTKESKEKKKTLKERKEEFQREVYTHSQYSKNILYKFFRYWSELSSNKKRMKFERLEFFEIEKRLEIWSENEIPSKPKTKLSQNR